MRPGVATAGIFVSMPAPLYDRVYAAASRERVSVPEVVRRAIVRALAHMENRVS